MKLSNNTNLNELERVVKRRKASRNAYKASNKYDIQKAPNKLCKKLNNFKQIRI